MEMIEIGAGPGHDVIVIGTSAGGVEALPRLLSELPAELPAAVCVVQHIMAGSRLVELLQRATTLPVQWAEHGDRLRPGEVFVAPAGVHMLLGAEAKIALAGGPRENRSRPAINRLFRSAAAHHGSRTIGILLTGMLDDGVAGLVAIKKVGGLVVVQDPDDAAFPDMPRNALSGVPVDRVLPLDAIAAALVLMCRQPAPDAQIPDEVMLEARIDADGPAQPATVERLGPQMPIACPECHGPIWETGDERSRGYRCYLGHVASPATLLAAQGTEVEQSLWAAVRSLQERATILTRMATDATHMGSDSSATLYQQRAREAHEHAERARHFLLELQVAQR